MRVLICAGGVIGACLAYLLSLRGVRPVAVKRAELACAASGKSGRFLTIEW
jgi:glycine/D-amino acid oxidase-like deaminating enzyme